MRIIEKIKIQYFRSFAGEQSIESCSDLNIFSGSNDSGKSNILRALNLFFTENKTDFYKELDFQKDFSRQRDEATTKLRKGKKFTIAVLFRKYDSVSQLLTDTFWVEKTWYKDRSATRETKLVEGSKIKKITEEDRPKFESATTRFLKRIHFQYVPAIKDESFFNLLIEEYQKSLGKDLQKQLKQLEGKIQDESKELFAEFLEQIEEVSKANFHIPNLEIDFAKTLQIETENKIDFKSRGDGIQTKLVPPLLNHISKDKKIVIWGFEEPENSLEYKNANNLAKEFLENYSKKKQIFITTHAKEFLGLHSEKEVSIYRVFKEDSGKSSIIIQHKEFDSLKARKEYAAKQLNLFGKNPSKEEKEKKKKVIEQICEDLGMIDETKLIFEIQEVLRTEPSEFKNKIENIMNELKSKNTKIKKLSTNLSEAKKPVIISEGKNFRLIAKAKEFFNPEGDYEIWDGGGKNEMKNIFNIEEKNNSSKKIMFVWDCDCREEEKFQNLKQKNNLVPFIFEKNKKNAIKLSGIENLFSQDFFEDQFKFREEFYVPKKDTKDGANREEFNNNKFADFIIKRNEKIDFENFKPLFEKIRELNLC